MELAGSAAAVGAAELLGWSPALLAGFTATPWGLLLSVGGALVAAGSALVFDLAQPWPDRLMAIEKALASACEHEIDGQHLRVSLRLDALLDAVDAARVSADPSDVAG